MYCSGAMNPTFKQNLIACFQQYFGNELVAIVLFGSRARGEASPESDYDIFPLAKKLPERPVERLLWVRHAIAAKFAEKISITVRTPEEFESGFPSLYLDLAIDGIVLYDADDYITKKLQRIQEIIKNLHQAESTPPLISTQKFSLHNTCTNLKSLSILPSNTGCLKKNIIAFLKFSDARRLSPS